jgi:hypothetical protein
MNDRVKSLIEKTVTTAVEDIAFNRVRDGRFGTFVKGSQALNAFAWICLDIIEVEEPKGSGNKSEKLWAHTNDFDPMVYGWSNCEFSLVTTDREEAIAKINAFLAAKFKDAEAVEVKYNRTSAAGGSLPILMGDSDQGDNLAEPTDYLVGC